MKNNNSRRDKDLKVNSSKSLKLVLEIAIIALFVLVAGLLAVLFLYTPSVGGEIPFLTGTSEVVTTVADPDQQPGDGDDDDNVTPAITDSGKVDTIPDYKRRDGVYNILLLGKDRVASLTDVFMIVSYDVKNHSMNITQIPRDTYTEYGSTYHKINGMFSHFYGVARSNKSKNLTKDALQMTTDFIQQNLSLKIDYYVLIDLDVLVQVVDIIGGVEIDIAQDMYYSDPEQNLYINLKAGKQTLTGAQSEQFVRFRSGYLNADIGRGNAQKQFMAAFLQKVKTSLTVSRVAEIANQIFKNVTTNMSAADCVYLAREALSIDLSKLVMSTMPGQDAREFITTGQWYYVINREGTLQTVNKYLNVFDQEIVNQIFDPNKKFTSSTAEHLNNIYIGKMIDGAVYIGDNLVENGIVIPRT